MSLETLTEKVEQLIDLADYKTRIQSLIDYNPVQIGAIAGCKLYDKQISELDFSRVTDYNGAFGYNENVKNFKLDVSNATALRMILRGCPDLETVEISGTGNVTNWNAAFSECPKLKSIKTLDFSSATGHANFVLKSLEIETLLFVPETIKVSITIPSPALSDESIQSIIDGLATVETMLTLTLHTDVVLKLTEAQYNTIANKNWSVG